MDEVTIYDNIQISSGSPGNNKNLLKYSEEIYANVDEIHSLEPDRTGPALSGAEDSERIKKKSFCRAAAVCLGLLCLLLLAGLITLVLLYADTKGKSEWNMEISLLHNSYINLTNERDQLQKRVEDMTKEINDLERKFQEKVLCDNSKKFGTSYYYISTEKKTWQESRKECQRKGADLVIINSEEEQKFVINLKTRFWIGLTDQEQEGIWKWVDGTTLTTKYWYPLQPDNDRKGGKTEDCAEIDVKSNDPLLKWNDAHCIFENGWVCELNTGR